MRNIINASKVAVNGIGELFEMVYNVLKVTKSSNSDLFASPAISTGFTGFKLWIHEDNGWESILVFF